MTAIRYFHLWFFTFLSIHHVNGLFTPDTNDYNAYGSKIAMNEHFFVLAQNNQPSPTFFIQFAPYNDTKTLSSAQCSINYLNNNSIFIYTVAIGKKQNQSQIHFFFAGELVNDQSGIFIGMVTYNNSNRTANNTYNTISSSCNTSFTYSLHYLYNYGHQEHHIVGIDPQGVRAYGFSNEFILIFDSQNTSSLDSWNGSLTWPHDSFIPHAVDISDNFGVIAGFFHNATNPTAKYSPMIYLMNFNSSNHHPITVDQYQPIATPGTWQNLLINEDADIYSAKYDMSVSIDKQGNVLVGMQFINRVFFFSVNITNPIRLNYISRFTNGRSLGNGKSVAWLNNGIAAILINVYSLNYVWLSSQIFFFDIYGSGYNSNSSPLSAFPNNYQLLPSSFSSIFLNIISSSSSLALLDSKGNILIFSATQPGFYPSIQYRKSIPIITLPKICLPGTYKNQSGVHDCVLCPTGTRNPGNSSTQCILCSSESFCPLGSVVDVSKSTLITVFQAVPYPQSPEGTMFDGILLYNMFNIGPDRCILVSPLFWALIVGSIIVLIIIIMKILKSCRKDPQSEKGALSRVFRFMSSIDEGKFWVSCIASFSIIVLISFAYAFSDRYLKQYPIEKSSDSYFACDLSIRNAKFETNLQSLAIPLTHAEQKMFDLLDYQNLTLRIDFVNTLISCDAISIQALYGQKWSTIRYLDCIESTSMLTILIALPYEHISVQISAEDPKTIGGLGIGLSGHGHKSERYTLEELHFYQSFSKDGQMLAQDLIVNLALTKMINETKPMGGEESQFDGIFIPTFTVDMNSLFVSNDQYVRSSSTLTTLTIVITETPYYVKNVQQPIVRQAEIIFRNLLFTIVCLKIFNLSTLLYTGLDNLLKSIRRRCEKRISKKKGTNDDPKCTRDLSKIDEINNNFGSFTL
ncbi:unnamed protein product [Rotaria sp. Silwood1]|nr:unnamed protein product [Rotaria sp. Silwood1]CAF5017116.1 unnamed protein product [Rotaria sp. Silwood1]